ncbi:hypothetical protein BdWA1_000381 [Babesia duncani]|uniref:Uncharacterized protein n=1 Tax=Babesia duncani TaxID=323732 RepID=A0AAD9UQ05_9APIC|nr:hypothetical protein BdWA1_000381 [Babesia duncani]
MERHISCLTTELLELTHRYLNAASLKSFVLPLPTSEENALDQKGLLTKILSNVSSVPKEKLYDIIKGLSYGSDNDAGYFNRAYEATMAMPRRQRLSRNQNQAMAKTRVSARQVALANANNSTTELQSLHCSDDIVTTLHQILNNMQNPNSVGFMLIIGLKQRKGRKASDDGRFL